MEKNEGGKRSSPGSSSRRTYSLFSSIINLSSSPVGRTNTSSSSPHTSTPNQQIKLSSDASKKKKKGDQSPSSGSSISNSSGVNAPMGPAPRTLSILTALNELAISDQTGADPSVASAVSRVGFSPTSVPQENSSSSSSTLPQLPPHHSMGKGKRGVAGETRKSLTMGRKPKALEKEPSKNRRSKSKERTPDWIWKIFRLAKHGRLEELQHSLKGLDPTLVRHLADAKGNTLLHCAARGGHVATLQWLVSILGLHTEAALNDRNRAGRTAILTALKGDQLECFQWLVLHTSCGDNALVPKEGDRSLLHFAANYGNTAAVRWLCQELVERKVQVDMKDAGGMTPLHMAAKSGRVAVCQELMLAGANPLCQTELGWRPSDLAIRHRHMECANYFLMAEAAGSLGSELHSLLEEFNALRQEHESLRTHFREVLRVGKWLVKERGDLIKSFPSVGSKSSPEASLLLGGTSNGARFSELEHKLVRAEQAWKRLQPVEDFSNAADLDFSLSSVNSTDLLQKRLASFRSRRDKGFPVETLLSGSSSDEESAVSDASSTSEEPRRRDHLRVSPHRPTNHTRHQQLQTLQNLPQQHVSLPHYRSTTAPWLLPPDDSLLSQLSPIVHQVNHPPTIDLLRDASSKVSIFLPTVGDGKVESGGGRGSPVQNSNVYCLAGSSRHAKSASPAVAVLEVIEPIQQPSSKESISERKWVEL